MIKIINYWQNFVVSLIEEFDIDKRKLYISITKEEMEPVYKIQNNPIPPSK